QETDLLDGRVPSAKAKARGSSDGRALPDLRSMTRTGRPNVHVLLPEQCRELLEVHAQISQSSATIKAPRKVIRMIAEIIGMKVALVCKEEGEWTVVAEWGSGPEIPATITEAKSTLDRRGAAANVLLELWRHDGHDWTLLGLTRRTGTPA